METARTDTNIAVGDHRDLLDIIDSLRSQGVSHYVDLPEIIVCGDQSAGKSSVLEAISGMPFPIKDGLCTRFATELVLRRGREVSIKVSITPGEDRFGEDKERLESWQPKASIDEEGLGTVTDEAKRAMADPTGTGEFYEDILRIELTGPEQPHLTMVDLPGLFRSGNKKQSDADVGIVRGMVERYMARPRSIILTVVSAKYEYVLQEVTLMAKHADPEGIRTMGLITKPDTLDIGSESERYFVRLTQNLEAELRLGWHVLKNRRFEERDVTSARRDEIENEFFSQGLWSSINSSHCGVAALRVRLSTILKDQILSQLPSLVQDVEDGIRDCADKLDRLGPERCTSQQQLGYLLRVSEEYTSLVTQAVEGTYTDHFFGNRKKKDKFSTRLRAVVQNRLGEFAEEMRLNGRSQLIIDSESEDEGGREICDLPRISRSKYVEGVANRLKYSKGRELPGLFNPLIVSDLFVDQCAPWRRIARLLAEDVLEAAHLTTQLILEHITASDVCEGVLKLIRQEIEGLKVAMDDQVDALLASAEGHPITYNPQLTENVQRIQQARHKRAIKMLVRKTFGLHRFDNPGSKISLNPIELVDLVGQGFESDMERFGSALAVDYMEAYYKARYILQPKTIHGTDMLASTSGCGDQVHRRRLQGLKSLHKRRNVNSPKQGEVASEASEKVSAMTRSWSGRASTTTDNAEAAPLMSRPNEPSEFQDRIAMPPSADKWPTQAETHDDLGDDWASYLLKKDKKRTSKDSMDEEPPVNGGWGH
ncbi:hypothetical protein CEP53_015254 [Fusarium sp. AF-6]|nr:hypothetical protein CEP53_015254 [Fusarium sp. AF-6]